MRHIRPTAPSIFESFNARALPPERLARIFIPNQEFEETVKRRHSIIVGPRGSGKTSMLKMLQPTALHAWQHPKAESYRAALDFIGVYIPCDISWREQLDSIGSGEIPREFRDALQRGILTAHVLYSFCSTLLDLKRLSLDRKSKYFDFFPKKAEQEIAKLLSDRWGVSSAVDTFNSLLIAVGAIPGTLLSFANADRFLHPDNRGQRFAANVHINRDFLAEMIFCVEVVNGITRKPDQKWGFLFDELEIAPHWLMHRLYGALRSIDQRIILKLSLSPYTNVGDLPDATAPREGQDFQTISLVYGYKSDARDFCIELFKSFLRSEGLMISDPKEVLGPSKLKAGIEERGRAYKPGSAHFNLLKRAMANDSSFREYCSRNAIELNTLPSLPQDQLASLVRKIMPSLLVRDTFRRADSAGGSQRKRSRKNPDIYGGADTFFEMLEGNPRWLIGITSEMLPIIRSAQRVPAAKQVELVNKSAARFRTVLNTIPLARDGFFKDESLLKLMTVAADKIHRSLVLDEFTSEPFGSFVIDEKVPGDILNTLGIALNAGAMVTVSKPSRGEFGIDIRGSRVRITYLLSAYFQIPVRLGREFPLSEALSSVKSVTVTQNKRSPKKTRPVEPNQLGFEL